MCLSSFSFFFLWVFCHLLWLTDLPESPSFPALFVILILTAKSHFLFRAEGEREYFPSHSAQFHSFLLTRREMHGIRRKEKEYSSQCFSSPLYKQFLSLFFGGGDGDWYERKEKMWWRKNISVCLKTKNWNCFGLGLQTTICPVLRQQQQQQKRKLVPFIPLSFCNFLSYYHQAPKSTFMLFPSTTSHYLLCQFQLGQFFSFSFRPFRHLPLSFF